MAYHTKDGMYHTTLGESILDIGICFVSGWLLVASYYRLLGKEKNKPLGALQGLIGLIGAAYEIGK